MKIPKRIINMINKIKKIKEYIIIKKYKNRHKKLIKNVLIELRIKLLERNIESIIKRNTKSIITIERNTESIIDKLEQLFIKLDKFNKFDNLDKFDKSEFIMI